MDQINILFIDDNMDLIQDLAQHFFNKYNVVTAQDGEEGLKIIERQGPFAAVICNIKMPGMDGVTFLYKVRKLSPNTRRIIMSSVADHETLIRVINKARIYHFVQKPCPTAMLEMIMDKAVDRYRFISAQRDIIDQTINSVTQAYRDILAMTNPVAYSRSSRVASIVAQMAKQLSLANSWLYELAGMLSQVGCVRIPVETMEKVFTNQTLNSIDQKLLSEYPRWSYELVKDLPKMDMASEMILKQKEDFTGPKLSVAPTLSDEEKEAIEAGTMPKPEPFDPYLRENLTEFGDIKLRPPNEVGAELLKVAVDFETLISSGHDIEGAIEALKNRNKDTVYNPLIINTLSKIKLPEVQKKIIEIPINQLSKHMTFEHDVLSKCGALLARKGKSYNATYQELFEKYFEQNNIPETIYVSVDSYD